jgi:hypothetical protein
MHADASADGAALVDAPADAAVDAAPDAPRQDFGTGAWTVHVETLPTAGVTLPGSIDTDTSPACATSAAWADASQPAACFVVATTITTSGNVVVQGSRPLVLVATDAVTVADQIDVASHRARGPGPAANWTGCGAPNAGGNRTSGGGGGAGGSFMTRGGDGGPGDSAAAGVAVDPLGIPAILHGGCPGSDGGNGFVASTAGPAGAGGGAIYVVAGNSISITGVINASGAAGGGGGTFAGGGGGGSGGMIVLAAPQVTAPGTLLANGGGGAAGGASSDGEDGSEEMPADPLAAPAGGRGPGRGGNGFTQGIDATAGANAASDSNGAGGGGGGGGFIGIDVAVTGGTYTPAPAQFP